MHSRLCNRELFKSYLALAKISSNSFADDQVDDEPGLQSQSYQSVKSQRVAHWYRQLKDDMKKALSTSWTGDSK